MKNKEKQAQDWLFWEDKIFSFCDWATFSFRGWHTPSHLAARHTFSFDSWDNPSQLATERNILFGGWDNILIWRLRQILETNPSHLAVEIKHFHLAVDRPFMVSKPNYVITESKIAIICVPWFLCESWRRVPRCLCESGLRTETSFLARIGKMLSIHRYRKRAFLHWQRKKLFDSGNKIGFPTNV